MVREGFVMPNLAGIESSSYSSTWRTMTGMNNFRAEKGLREADLHLFFLAGELRVLQPGWGMRAIRRGINRLLAIARKSDVNCMEITQISPKRFWGLPYVAISAYRFHIQKGSMLHSQTERKSAQSDSDWACG